MWNKHCEINIVKQTLWNKYCQINIENIQNRHKMIKIAADLLSFLIIMAWESNDNHCAVCGYNVYKSVWEPKESELLSCSHEVNNIYNMSEIKTCLTDGNGKQQIVGHLSLELFLFTKYLLDRGAIVTVKLSSTHYGRSVLGQRGLEIPCMVKSKIIVTEKNKRILAH